MIFILAWGSFPSISLVTINMPGIPVTRYHVLDIISTLAEILRVPVTPAKIESGKDLSIQNFVDNWGIDTTITILWVLIIVCFYLYLFTDLDI